jgi:putative membrane-bound dehydrogenase-like protein
MKALLVFLLPLVVSADPALPPGKKSIPLTGQNFTVPEGFELELVAGPPLVDRPIHADFDEQGRLYVCESSGTNDKVDKQLAEKPHWIVRLEDTDGDGRFDRCTQFAEHLMFPEGMLWHAGSVFVAAPPSIWKLTDTDNDGIADVREEWFAGKTLTGCANDLHGPYLGADGWIYWAKGAFAEQTYPRPGKSPLVTRAAHIFRSRPDGTGIEPVMTGGMDNPVEVAFTPGGERIFTTTFLQQPGHGNRDGLIHAIYGGVYGKVNDVVAGHPRTGDLMPVLSHLGPAAPAGLACYESSHFGREYQGNLFAALFNLRKITRHVLTKSGGTFASRDEDFLVSDSFDFHPTDVLEDADGSLLVVNTGGWYKLCCPSSQLWKPDILGGIYRIRRTDAERVADPRGLTLDWKNPAPEELAKRLSDARPAVRKRAGEALAGQGPQALIVLEKTLANPKSAEARRRAVWTLARIDAPTARTLVRIALHDADETVRQAAAHSISVWRDRDAVPDLLRLLARGSPFNRRAAAEALGRLGHPAAVPVLLSVAGEELDRTLEHSVIYALIEIASRAETEAGLQSENPRTRRAALLAIDQMEGKGLQPDAVAELLASPEPRLRETAAWIVGRHRDWGPALAPFLAKRLAARNLTDDERALLARLLAEFASNAEIQTLLASGLANEGAARSDDKTVILQAMSRSGLAALPDGWVAPLAAVLRSDSTLAPLAVSVVRAVPSAAARTAELHAALLAAAADERLSTAQRLEALGAAPGGIGQVDPRVFDFMRANLTPDAQVSVRLSAADALSKARLDDRQLVLLAALVRSAGPLEIERVVAPYAHSSSDEVGKALAAALAECSALTSLRPEFLQEIFKHYGPAVEAEARTVYKLLAASTEKQKNKIEELLALLPRGDIRRGQSVFNSQKAACTTCHGFGYVGGSIGPDLTKIGGIRTERDLLEAIVFPSASFVRSYEPVVVTTKAGKTFAGTIRPGRPDEVVLALNAKETVHIPRDEIEELVPGTVSIMPAGLDQQLSSQELVDLITFLKSAK